MSLRFFPNSSFTHVHVCSSYLYAEYTVRNSCTRSSSSVNLGSQFCRPATENWFAIHTYLFPSGPQFGCALSKCSSQVSYKFPGASMKSQDFLKVFLHFSTSHPLIILQNFFAFCFHVTLQTPKTCPIFRVGCMIPFESDFTTSYSSSQPLTETVLSLIFLTLSCTNQIPNKVYSSVSKVTLVLRNTVSIQL